MDYNTYLTHHGIKGMKWGVRRYQHEDGSYTREGRERYNSSLKKGYIDSNGKITRKGRGAIKADKALGKAVARAAGDDNLRDAKYLRTLEKQERKAKKKR